MPVDVLSDVLRAVRLTGVVYFDFSLTAPWVAEGPPSREIAGTVLPGSERVIEYHLLVQGSAWGQAIGGEPIRLREGDLLLFPQGDAHVVSSAPGMRSTRTVDVRAPVHAAPAGLRARHRQRQRPHTPDLWLLRLR
jgi:hypothetical protein